MFRRHTHNRLQDDLPQTQATQILHLTRGPKDRYIQSEQMTEYLACFVNSRLRSAFSEIRINFHTGTYPVEKPRKDMHHTKKVMMVRGVSHFGIVWCHSSLDLNEKLY